MASAARLLGVAIFSFTLAACATYGPVRDAERGDFPSLARHLTDEYRAGRLNGGKVRDVARAVAKQALRVTSGPAAVTRVDDLRGCASSLVSAFEDRASGRDAGAARAAYVLVDTNLADASSWSDRASSRDPAWRAVGARSLFESGAGPKRRALLLDVDTAVRRAALQAALDAQDPADTAALLETVRLDPDGLARNTAARAVGRIGGRDVVLALKDRWVAADEPLRAAIVTAWGLPKSDDAGGREQLRWVIGSERGSPAIVAANLLVRRGGENAAYGTATLTRVIADDTTANRVMAILLASWNEASLREAVIAAAKSSDGDVRVAALSKLTRDPKLRRQALTELGPMAADSAGPARGARAAMAEAQDRRVVLLLAPDLHASSPDVRVWAAGLLANLGDLGRMAPLLADPDPSVRTRVACAVLGASRK